MKRLALILRVAALGGCSANGIEGAPGPAGSAGPEGVEGPSGEAGAAGSPGPQGPVGPQGTDGTSSLGAASVPREAGTGSAPNALGEATVNATTASERNYIYSGSVLLDHDGRCLLTAVVTMFNAVDPSDSAANAAVAYTVGNGPDATCGLANFVATTRTHTRRTPLRARSTYPPTPRSTWAALRTRLEIS